MNYGEIKECDIANGIGVRVSLFVSGCRNGCKNCFNQDTWDFCYGKPFTSETMQTLLHLLSPSYIDGLSVLGGEPMEPENQHALLPILQAVREAYPRKTIWLYTGCVLQNNLQMEERVQTEDTKTLLSLLDVMVDGRFVEEKKDITLLFRGSSNQRLIDMPKTLGNKKIVLWEPKKI